jgi:hypothetical protein
MNKVLGIVLAAVAVLGLSTAQVLARGGGHGGGHHGGGHHGGGHHGGHHSHHSSHSHHHSGHHSHTHSHHGDHHHYHHSNWAHHNRPFSHGWYGRHGGAWGYGWGGWGWGNPWAVATFGATAAWLGLDAAEPYYGNYGTVGGNYLTSDETTEPETYEGADSNDSADDTAENSETDENQTTENAITPAPITPEQIEAAKQLIAEGKNDPPKETSFLPLGVFSIAPEGQHEASAMVQLAVSKAGQVRGTYYDLLTDHDQPIRGAVNKKTQQVAFTFGDNGKVTFETSLANLTQPTGAIAAHFENGQTTSYTLARYAKEPSENEAGEASPAAKPQSETAVQ